MDFLFASILFNNTENRS